MTISAQGTHFGQYARWPCCSGTLPRIAADYTISAYFRAPDGVYVNLYVPSRLTWTMNSVRCVLELTREQLARPRLARAGNNDWTLDLGQSNLLLRPFAGIGEEVYQTYCKVRAA